MADYEGTGKDPKLKLFIRLPRERFSTDQEESIKNQLFDLLGDTPVKDFEPHINKGYCFLHFENRLLAAVGHDKIFNSIVNGYTIRPFFGFTRTEQRAVDAGIKDEEIERNHRTVYVKDLPEGANQEQIQEIFKEYGDVAKVNLVKTRSGSAAFVLFQKFTPAMKCLEQLKDGFELQGQTVSVELSKNKNLQRRIEKFSKSSQGPYNPGYGQMQRGGFNGPRGGGPAGHRGSWGGRNGGGQQGGQGGPGQWNQYWAQWANWAQNQGGGRGGGASAWAPWMKGGRGRGGPRGGGRGGGRSQYGRRTNPY